MLELRAAAVALALSGLAAPAGAAEPSGASPQFAVTGFAVPAADAEGTTLEFTGELSNPGARSVTLSAVRFTLEVGGKRLVEGALEGGEEVPPGKRVSVSFPGRIRYADLPMLAAKTLVGRRVPFKLVATAELRTPAGPIALPVAYDGELSMPLAPGVGLAGLRVTSWNPFDAAVEVRVSLENGNAFPLPSGVLRYKLTVAGGDLTEAEAALPAVSPGGKTVVAIPLKISVKKVGAKVMRALKGDAAMVGLVALASLGPFAWPVDVQVRLPTR